MASFTVLVGAMLYLSIEHIQCICSFYGLKLSPPPPRVTQAQPSPTYAASPASLSQHNVSSKPELLTPISDQGRRYFFLSIVALRLLNLPRQKGSLPAFSLTAGTSTSPLLLVEGKPREERRPAPQPMLLQSLAG